MHGTPSLEIKIEEMRAVAKSRKGSLISNEYISAKHKYAWRCALGHEFEASWNLVSRQTWCPKCANLSNYTENQVRQIFEAIFEGYKFPNVRPDFLKTSRNGRLEIDGYCEELAIAFEFDGPHHFQVTQFSNKANLASIQKRDEKKENILGERGIQLIRVDYRDDLSLLPKRLYKEITENRPELKTYNFDIDVGLINRFSPSEYLERLASVAEHKGGELLSKVYLGEKNKLKFRCAQGHEWEAMPTNILRGKWCRKCSHSIRVASRKDLLNWQTVRKIREAYAQGGITYTELGQKYGVSRVTISNIVNNKTRTEY